MNWAVRTVKPSSRTPEGTPSRCPVCGNEVCIEPSTPSRDAPCPCCGHLLWFPVGEILESVETVQSQPLPRQLPSHVGQPDADLNPVDRLRLDSVIWSVNTLGCCALIYEIDRSLPSVILWAAMGLAIAWGAMPAFIQAAEKFTDRRRSLWLTVVVAWSIIPGPLAGTLLGAASPLLWEMPCTALQGAFVGLLVGPLLAPLEGISIAALFAIGFRLITGQEFGQDPLLWLSDTSRSFVISCQPVGPADRHPFVVLAKRIQRAYTSSRIGCTPSTTCIGRPVRSLTVAVFALMPI